jgi:hypothetical protein
MLRLMLAVVLMGIVGAGVVNKNHICKQSEGEGRSRCVSYCVVHQCQYQETRICTRLRKSRPNSPQGITYPCDPDCGIGGTYNPLLGPLQCECADGYVLASIPNTANPISGVPLQECVVEVPTTDTTDQTVEFTVVVSMDEAQPADGDSLCQELTATTATALQANQSDVSCTYAQETGNRRRNLLDAHSSFTLTVKPGTILDQEVITALTTEIITGLEAQNITVEDITLVVLTSAPTTGSPSIPPSVSPSTENPNRVPTNNPSTTVPTPTPTNNPSTTVPTPTPTRNPTRNPSTAVPTLVSIPFITGKACSTGDTVLGQAIILSINVTTQADCGSECLRQAQGIACCTFDANTNQCTLNTYPDYTPTDANDVCLNHMLEDSKNGFSSSCVTASPSIPPSVSPR